ncbi:unnamed protein product [Meganyctiphanes norvegica]|uniref:Vitellogenin domain-containing protein n=1 Tax=Meganyctiphanes norvegica TaxID=48144 RepID=A0AAV2S5P1_MEGNR
MAPSGIVALCLLALASAAPQNLQSLQCATSCDSTRQATVGEIGKTYSFNYNVLSSVKLSGVNEGITQGGLTGTVDVSRINPCELAIKFTSSNEADNVNKYPLVVTITEDVQFGKACAHPEDDSESINIKKGIVSALQYSLPSFTPTKKQIISETSVLGTCPTAYSVVNKGENVVVNKVVTHSECHDHVYSQSKIPSLLSKSPMPLQVSNSVCTQVFSSNKVPQTITCKDTKVLRPTYGAYKYIEATQESTLQFVSESTDMSVLSSFQGSQLLSKKLSHEHSMPSKNPALVGKLDAILSNVCEMVQGQGHQDTASIVNEAIELLEHIPDDAFVTILSKIRAGGYCADYTKLEALYMDAIAFIGEPGALKVIAQEVNAGRVTGGRTALYTAALHLLTKPTAKHVAALTPIAAMEEPTSTLILAVASVVNKHCKLVSECENTPAVKNILNLLTGKLVKQCTASFSNSNPITVIATLKTLGNIGYLAAEHAEEVIKCAKTKGVETNVRFAAMMALKAAPCKNTVKSALLATVLDQGMNTEVELALTLLPLSVPKQQISSK